MKIKITTKWGQITIDPNEVYEVNAKVNPWDNEYRVEFIIEGRRDRVYADLKSSMEVALLLKKIAVEMDIIRKYKFKDRQGHIQINEPLRLHTLRERERGAEDE